MRAGVIPTFDVAPVQAADSAETMSCLRFLPDGISMSNMPMRLILGSAFHAQPERPVGIPGRIRNQHFNVEAKVAAEDAPAPQIWTDCGGSPWRLRSSEDRFHLNCAMQEQFGLKVESQKAPSMSF